MGADPIQGNHEYFLLKGLAGKKSPNWLNNQTFISSMLNEIGGHNIFSDQSQRYFECSLEEIKKKNPDIVLLSSEPYPFQEKHIQEIIRHGFKENQVQLIDGEMCSWHGIRMVAGLSYLEEQKRSWL